MRGQPSVWRRTQRLGAVHRQEDLLRVATRLAGELGIRTEELLAEARALRRRAEAVGAMTTETLVAFVATESGIPADELRAELDLACGRPA